MQINKIKTFIKKIVKESENHQLSGILIRGNDEAGFEHVFNRGTFIKKIRSCIIKVIKILWC